VDHPAPNPPDVDERTLVDRARRGDAEAFRVLVDLHQDRAYGLALRVLRSPADAQEVAQDAFVKAWRALPGFRGDSKFGTWLHAIVVRRALDRAATLKSRRGREVELDAGAEHGTTDVGTSAERAALRLRMEKMLDRLSDAQRAVVTLFYYEERSVDDVAAALGMPTGTVKTHLSRARAALREAWLETHGGERT
jgi:RNA polymerase sigma-70 factor (ECF subfamily)